MDKPIWRRFVLIDKSKEKALLALVEQKGLTREDIMLILSTVKLKKSYPARGT